MTVRRATAADATLIRQLHDDFMNSIGGRHPRQTLVEFRKRYANISAFIDPDIGAYCDAWLMPKREEGNIGRWYPRGVSVRLLVPVLAACLRDLATNNPDKLHYEMTGEFVGAVDARGNPDGARSISETMARFFQVRGRTVIRIEERKSDGQWFPIGRLGELIAALEERGV